MAVIVATVSVDTGEVDIVKVADTCPEETVTEPGTVALDEFELSVTTVPVDGALLERVAVPVALLPPTTDVGEMVTLARVAAVIVRLAVFWLEPIEAVIVAVWSVPTASVVIVKFAVAEFAGIVTVVGTWAAPKLEVTLTTGPGPVPLADAETVTVPVLEIPPATDVGLTVRLLTVNGLTVNVAV